MEEILRRLLDVEREADLKVREAEAEAERILDQGRRDAAALRASLQRGMVAEGEALIAADVGRAEAEKSEALKKVAAEVDAARAGYEKNFAAAVAAVRSRLACSPPGTRPSS